MKRILVIGIGVGDPAFVTMDAIRALNELDVVLAFDKGDSGAAVRQAREAICEQYVTRDDLRVVTVPDPPRRRDGDAYRTDVAEWHAARADRLEDRIAVLDDHETAGFLVWGDPSLYDSTLRILDDVRRRGRTELSVEVVPGISSVQVLAARHGIALHAVGGAVTITTGRRLSEGWPAGADDVVVMLDGRCAFTQIDPVDTSIYWGAYLGSEHEILVAGPLDQVGPEIVARRAAARREHGWMFDIYVLRRRPPGASHRP